MEGPDEEFVYLSLVVNIGGGCGRLSITLLAESF